MVLGEGARFLVRRGFAQQRSKEAMLETLDRARALGLTHITDNVRDRPSFICNCCRCCCELLAGVQMGFAEGIAKTPFLAAIDPARCDYCGECLKACNVKCIGLADGARGLPRDQRHAAPDTAVCLGCGACLSACEKAAITLVPRQHPEVPPRNKARLFARILWEKGRLMPFVVEGLKHPLRVLYGSRSRRL
jgi:NAD-dependent dihydropyrimidine dehydrogenase PreA subunit